MDDDFLTIMFVRNSGKIRSIKVETKKLFYLAAGIISLILAFVDFRFSIDTDKLSIVDSSLFCNAPK